MKNIIKKLLKFLFKKESVIVNIPDNCIIGNEYEELIKIAEEYLIDSGIDLNHVYIHNENSDGVCIYNFFKYNKKITVGILNNDTIKFDINSNKHILILPELHKTPVNSFDFFFRLSVWFHEIAHYIFKHNTDYVKDISIIEYEACKYSEEIMKRLPIIDKSAYLLNFENIFIHTKNIRNIHLDYIILENKSYVKKYINNKNKMFLPNEVLEYIKD